MFFEQYELREIHFSALLRIKEAEVQLERAKAEDQRKKAEAEALKSRTLSTQVSTFSQTETELRNQLNIYVEKFKQAGCPSPMAHYDAAPPEDDFKSNPPNMDP